jgi:hypothetical protein
MRLPVTSRCLSGSVADQRSPARGRVRRAVEKDSTRLFRGGHVDTIAERLVDEAEWIRQCAVWLDHLERESFPPVADLRLEGDFPDRSNARVPRNSPRLVSRDSVSVT